MKGQSLRCIGMAVILALTLMTAVSYAREFDYGDQTSETLVRKAWDGLNEKDYEAVYEYTQKCIDLFAGNALAQQASLTDFAPKDRVFDYWALNDVGVSYFIRGKAFTAEKKVEKAIDAFNMVSENYKYSQCWDPNSKTFWKVGEAAKDEMQLVDKGYDFGDYTSATLTSKAWQALTDRDFAAVTVYTEKCIKLYGKEAAKQQATLNGYAPKDRAFDYWALNDVGTCYFIQGESFLLQNDYQKAKDAFKKVVEEYSLAQCWDPKGWFWKPAVASRGRLNKIAAEYEME